MKTEQRLKELGIELTAPTSPMANYVNAVRTGNLLFLAGKGPGLPGKKLPTGKVGRDFTVEQAYVHARETGLSLIAVMKAELGDLDRVKRIVKVLGMVNATPEFGRQPEVINGCSDLFVTVFGTVLYWTFRVDRTRLSEFSQMPLDDATLAHAPEAQADAHVKGVAQ